MIKIKLFFPDATVRSFGANNTITLRTPSGLETHHRVKIYEIGDEGVTLMQEAPHYSDVIGKGQVVKIYDPVLNKCYFARFASFSEDGFVLYSRIYNNDLESGVSIIDFSRNKHISVPTSAEVLEYIEAEAKAGYVWNMDTCTYSERFDADDLEPGMVVELRDGDRYLLIEQGDELIGINCGSTFITIDDTTVDFLMCCPNNNNYDIMKVFNTRTSSLDRMLDDSHLTLIWTR